MNHSKLCVAVMVVTLVGLCASSPGGVRRHDRDDLSYLNLAADAAYAAVGQISFVAGSVNYAASGTLISSEWVQTAGHVVDDATSLQFTIGNQAVSGTNWVPHPRWNGDLLGGYDIGLVQLASPITGVTPATLYTGSDELGADSVSVGYGMTGTGLTGATVFDGAKRAGQNVIDAFYRTHPRKAPTILMSDFDNPDDPADNAYGTPLPLNLEYLIAPGDSGGGMFVDFADDDLGPLLAGVHSFVGSFDGDTDCDYGDVSGHIRVSAFTKWIDEVINGEGPGGGKGNGKGNGKGLDKSYYDLPFVGLDSANVVPEPATMSLLALGGLALIRRRRK